MIFNSWIFVLFFGVFLWLWYTLPFRLKRPMALAASYLFYGWWDWRFLGLLFLTTFIDFKIGQLMDRTTADKARKRLLIYSLVSNLSILGFFKYFNFFVASLHELLTNMGLEVAFTTLNIVLPVGISFYTFQSLSYTIDVYRRDLKATNSLWEFALFVTLFPQLVAGPIERATHLLPQVQNPKVPSRKMIWEGITLLLIGYFQKVAIADNLAPKVDEIFQLASNSYWPSFVGWFSLYSTAIFFALQIYCDFSGYSSIARGAGLLFGFRFMENFNQPYFSTNITEFWRRWHISLSQWLRDYLYIPLGGNRHGTYMTYRNLIITMLLGGLWHGANWTYVVWGGLHGIALAVHKFALENLKFFRFSSFRSSKVGKFLGMIITFHLVLLAWVYFRSPDISTANRILRGIFSFRGGFGNFSVQTTLDLAWYLTLILAVDIPQRYFKDHSFILHLKPAFRGLIWGAMFVIIILMGSSDDQAPFIYFQF